MIISNVYILVALLMPFIGAVLFRMKGGMKPHLPSKLDEVLIGFIFVGLPVFLITGNPFIGFVSAMLAAVAKASGHGQWMTLASPDWYRSVNPEKLDFIVKWFYGRDPRPTKDEEYQFLPNPPYEAMITRYGKYKFIDRNKFGLFISGLAVGLPLVLALLYVSLPVLAVVAVLGFGVGKSLAYLYGWTRTPEALDDLREGLKEPTQIGEALSGFFAGVASGIIMLAAV